MVTTATKRPRDPELDESRVSLAFKSKPWLAPATMGVAMFVAVGLSLLFGYVWDQKPLPIDASGFIVTAGLFVAALAIERLTELLVAPWVGNIGGKASRTVVIGTVAAVLGVIVTGSLGLYLLEILTGGIDVIHTGIDEAGNQVDKPFVRSIDIFVTAMAIAGGTKPLHDLLTSLEKGTTKAKDDVADDAPDVVDDPTGSPYRLEITLTEPVANSSDGAVRQSRFDEVKKDISRIVPESKILLTPTPDAEPAPDDPVRKIATGQVSGVLPFGVGSPSYVQAVYELAYRLAASGYAVEPDLAAPASLTVGVDSTDPRPEADARDWAIKQMNLTVEDIEDAFDGDGITIGHPDTGYRPNELQPNWDLHRDYDFVDNDADALDSLVKQANVFEPDFVPARGHGSSTSSILGGQWGNPTQMYSMARKATIIPYRVMHGPVHMFDSDVAEAVHRAVDDGCDVISMSLGGFGFSGLRDAIKHAVNEGVIVVAAAGNQVGVIVSPADYPETIAVASSKANGFPFAEGSSQGPEITITAPGTDVWRVGIDEKGNAEVSQSTGTSYATAHVAGVAALWRSKHKTVLDTLPDKHTIPSTFAYLLKTTATEWEIPEHADGFGPGIINAGALLAASFVGDNAPTEAQLEEAMPTNEPEPAIVKITAIGANFFVGDGTNDIKTKIVQSLVGFFGADNKRGEEAAGADQHQHDQNVQAVVKSEAEHHYQTDPEFRDSVDDTNATPSVPAGATREFRGLVGAFNASTDGDSARGAMSKTLRRSLAGKASVRGRYRWVGMLVLLLALAFSFGLGYRWGVDDPVRIATSTTVLFTVFYVAAQALERTVEYTFGRVVFYKKPDRVTERALILLGITIALGCLLAGATGFRLLEALAGEDASVNELGDFSRTVSVFVTGLAIGGGTKPLHDLISRIQARSKAA
jgi:hypothetical protein